MHKYSLVLATILTLFSGCGGGGTSDGNNASLETSSTQNSPTTIQSSLQNAGYTNASDVVELDTNTIAFTYMQGDNKHFVVYDNLNGKVLSNIPSFSGDSAISNNESSITFENGTKVNVDNYTDAKVETQPQYTNPASEKTPKEKINNQLSGSQYVSQFVYSPQRQGAAVLIKSAGDTLVGLYLYGLEGSSPVREESIYPIDDEGLSITDITFPESGKITFIVHQMDWKYYYTYYQSSKYLSQTNVVKPDGSTQSSSSTDNSNSGSTTSVESIINNSLPSGQYVDQIIYTQQKQGGVVVVKTPGDFTIIYFYGFENPSNPVREATVYDTSEQGDGGERISDITAPRNGEFTYRVSNFGYSYTNTYRY